MPYLQQNVKALHISQFFDASDAARRGRDDQPGPRSANRHDLARHFFTMPRRGSWAQRRYPSQRRDAAKARHRIHHSVSRCFSTRSIRVGLANLSSTGIFGNNDCARNQRRLSCSRAAYRAYAVGHTHSSTTRIRPSAAPYRPRRRCCTCGSHKNSSRPLAGSRSPIDRAPSVNDGPATIDPKNQVGNDVKLKALPAGTYTVKWHALSVDTHTTEGDFTFQVKKELSDRSALNRDAPTPLCGERLARRHFVFWCLIPWPAFRQTKTAQAFEARLDRQLFTLAWASLLVAVVSGAVWLVVVASNMSGTSLGAVLQGGVLASS